MKTLIEYIEETIITEMAKSLSDFKQLVSDLSDQIVENWCLVKWCDTHPNELKSKQLRNHWATELKSYLYKISRERLKSGRKDKVIKDEWIKHLELNDTYIISDIIRDKFEKEGLEKYIYIVAAECAKSSSEICNVLNSKSPKEIEDYVPHVWNNVTLIFMVIWVKNNF